MEAFLLENKGGFANRVYDFFPWSMICFCRDSKLILVTWDMEDVTQDSWYFANMENSEIPKTAV